MDQAYHHHRLTEDLAHKRVDDIVYDQAFDERLLSRLHVYLKDGSSYLLELPEPLAFNLLKSWSQVGVEVRKKSHLFSIHWRELPWILARLILTFFLGFFIYSALLRIGIGYAQRLDLIGFTSENSNDLSPSLGLQREIEVLKDFVVDPSQNGLNFNDVYGNEEAKEELKDFLKWLKTPDYFKKNGIHPPLGILLYGDPGNGKTLMAKALAGECQVPFIAVSGSYFEEIFIGIGSRRVRALFELARQLAPCIVFIDEIDCLASKRNFGDSGASRMTLNQLLTEMDGFNKPLKQAKPVLVLGATNHPKLLDAAIKRPGRFDRKTSISGPNHQERKSFIRGMISHRQMPIDARVDFETLTNLTVYKSFAWILEFLNETAFLAWDRKADLVGMQDFNEAFMKMSYPHKPSKSLTEISKARMAWQVAAEALVGWRLMPEEAQPFMASLKPAECGWGIVEFLKPKSHDALSLSGIRNKVCLNLSRSCASALHPQGLRLPEEAELERMRLAKKYAFIYFQLQLDPEPSCPLLLEGIENGWKSFYKVTSNLPQASKERLESSVDQLIKEEWARCLSLIEKESSLHQAIQRKLLDKGQISREELKALFDLEDQRGSS